MTSKYLRYFHEEKKKDKAVIGLMRKHREHRHKKWQDKVSTVRVAPAAELKTRQEALIAMGREQRAQRTEPEGGQKELRAFLSAKFGSVA